MTTATWTSVIDHSGDVGFRAWSKEISDNLQAIGLIQTADTGQIDFVTVVKPGIGGVGGYQIYRFNDALQATKPVFIKIEYASSPQNALTPFVWMTVGTASNGSGTVTGVGLARIGSSNQVSWTTSAVTTYPSYACVKDGYLMLAFKCGAPPLWNPTMVSIFAIGRTTDTSGVNTGDGICVVIGSQGQGTTTNYPVQMAQASYSPALQLASASANGGGAPNAYSMIYGNVTSSLVSGVPQIYRHSYAMPTVAPYLYTATGFVSEIVNFSTFSDALVGVTNHTYLMLHNAKMLGVEMSTNHALCVMYE